MQMWRLLMGCWVSGRRLNKINHWVITILTIKNPDKYSTASSTKI